MPHKDPKAHREASKRFRERNPGYRRAYEARPEVQARRRAAAKARYATDPAFRARAMARARKRRGVFPTRPQPHACELLRRQEKPRAQRRP
jgi:hypothetical protein